MERSRRPTGDCATLLLDEIGEVPPAMQVKLLRVLQEREARELENDIERAVVLARGSLVEVEDLPEEIVSAAPSIGASGEPKSLDEVERDHILTVLRSTEGNREEAAGLLGIGAATLYRRLKRYRAESAEGS